MKSNAPFGDSVLSLLKKVSEFGIVEGSLGEKKSLSKQIIEERR
jgi:hypothetical protein